MSLRKERVATTEHVLWNGAVEVRCFGRKTGDWTLKPTAMEAERGNPTLLQRLAYLREHYECGRIVIPNPSLFNSAIVHSRDNNAWNEEWLYGHVVRGPYADAVVFTEGTQSFAVASADCPTVILNAPDKGITVAAHAGRDSLFDRSFVLEGVRIKNRGSVIDEMVHACMAYGADPRSLRAFIACGISGARFSHHTDNPEHGPANVKIIEHFVREYGKDTVLHPKHGTISLLATIRSQLRSHSVRDDRIGHDAADTYGDLDTDGAPVWASQRRDGKGRNLVLVTIR